MFIYIFTWYSGIWLGLKLYAIVCSHKISYERVTLQRINENNGVPRTFVRIDYTGIGLRKSRLSRTELQECIVPGYATTTIDIGTEDIDCVVTTLIHTTGTTYDPGCGWKTDSRFFPTEKRYFYSVFRLPKPKTKWRKRPFFLWFVFLTAHSKKTTETDRHVGEKPKDRPRPFYFRFIRS